jgi:hypothetical protein
VAGFGAIGAPARRFIYNAIYNTVAMIAGIVPMLVIVLLRDCKSHRGATGHKDVKGSPRPCLA